MTITQLRNRLNAIIAENEQRGRAERNELPVLVETHERYQTPTGKRKDRRAFFPLESASSSRLHFSPGSGFDVEPSHYMTLNAGKVSQ